MRKAENRRVSHSTAAPAPALREFVERVSFSSDESAGKPPAVRVVPDGAIDVLFSVSGADCSAHVFGLKTRPFLAESDGPCENVLLRLRPGAALRLFGVPACELTDRAAELGLLVGPRAAEWRDRVAAAPSAEARHETLARAFGDWARHAAREPDADDSLLRRAVSRIRRVRGELRIQSLAAELGIGERRLERLFLARVGVTPKAFARISRFFAAYESLGAGAEPLDAALAHGYFDQAHLNRDFRALAGAPPRRIFPSVGRRRADSLRA
jgi:methylphosphotriester-DNA--protein-cysteine methyltransferase